MKAYFEQLAKKEEENPPSNLEFIKVPKQISSSNYAPAVLPYR